MFTCTNLLILLFLLLYFTCPSLINFPHCLLLPLQDVFLILEDIFLVEVSSPEFSFSSFLSLRKHIGRLINETLSEDICINENPLLYRHYVVPFKSSDSILTPRLSTVVLKIANTE